MAIYKQKTLNDPTLNESQETSETVDEFEEDYDEYMDYDYFEKERAENSYERDFTLRNVESLLINDTQNYKKTAIQTPSHRW